jgi:hypothetical protein
MLVGLLVLVPWCWHCWLDGQRDAYTFCIPAESEASRMTRHWRYSTVHGLLLMCRIVPHLFLLLLLVLLTGNYDGVVLSLSFWWCGDRIRNGSMRVEQRRSFFEGGHCWISRLPFRCPDWLLFVGWPVVSIRRNQYGWLWEFQEMNGKLSFALACLVLVAGITIAWRS